MKKLIKVFLIVTVLTGAVNFCYAQKNIEKPRSGFVTPKVSGPETLHILLKVTDNGSPSLDSYQRLIITVVP